MSMQISNLMWFPLFTTVLRTWLEIGLSKINSKPYCPVLVHLSTPLVVEVLTWCMATSVNHVLPSWSIVSPWGIKNLDKKKHRIQKRKRMSVSLRSNLSAARLRKSSSYGNACYAGKWVWSKEEGWGGSEHLSKAQGRSIEWLQTAPDVSHEQ